MSNKQTLEKELAEQLVLTVDELALIKLEHIKEEGVIREDIRNYVFAVREAQLHKALNHRFTIEGGVCPECKTGEVHKYKHIISPRPCLKCKGTGKLYKTFTLAKLIKEKMR